MTASTVPSPTSLAVTELPSPTATINTSQAGYIAKRVAIALGEGVLTLAVITLAWQAILAVVDVDPFSARKPMQAWHALTNPANDVLRHQVFTGTGQTMLDAFVGLIVGTIAGLLGALMFTRYRATERTLLGPALALRCVPLVALTPLIVQIFGRGLVAVTVIAGIVTFFPTLINVNLALRQVPKASVDLIRAYGGTENTTIRKVQLPSALPMLFASMRIAAPLAFIGAVLAEFLATGKGLGALMASAAPLSDYDTLWVAVAVVTLASVVLYTIVSAVEEVVLARYAPEQSKAART